MFISLNRVVRRAETKQSTALAVFVLTTTLSAFITGYSNIQNSEPISNTVDHMGFEFGRFSELRGREVRTSIETSSVVGDERRRNRNRARLAPPLH